MANSRFDEAVVKDNGFERIEGVVRNARTNISKNVDGEIRPFVSLHLFDGAKTSEFLLMPIEIKKVLLAQGAAEKADAVTESINTAKSTLITNAIKDGVRQQVVAKRDELFQLVLDNKLDIEKMEPTAAAFEKTLLLKNKLSTIEEEAVDKKVLPLIGMTCSLLRRNKKQGMSYMDVENGTIYTADKDSVEILIDYIVEE